MSGSRPANADGPALRAWRHPDREILIRVTDWLFQAPVTDQYFEREASVGILWNYLWRYGPITVIRKIRSRLAERRRNDKFAGVGRGVVLEAPLRAGLPRGATVLFLAGNAPGAAEELVIDARLVVPVSPSRALDLGSLSDAVGILKGFSPSSGAALPEAPLQALRSFADPVVELATESLAARTSDTMPGRAGRRGRPTAVVFGLGNYAKTLIIPNIRHRLELACVHEIDPDQLAYLSGSGVALDTCPHAREDETYDAWFIAGYHHTHAELAVTALERGGYAVVEKPVATDAAQFARLRDTLSARIGGPRMFACFQKRYAAFNRYVHEDLGVAPGQAVHMAALVYEVPLPKLHWYNWPNSGSRIISNACHWLDYFMWLNNYSHVNQCTASYAGLDDVHCMVNLENGASLLLELTHNGSERLGVREVIELRSQRASIRIVDAHSYSSENIFGIIRRIRVNPVDAYNRMYRKIADVIMNGGPADPFESLLSTELMLTLEAILAAETPSPATERGNRTLLNPVS